METRPPYSGPGSSDAPEDIATIRAPRELGAIIRDRRKRRAITLVQAAGLTGVGVRFLHELEHGKATAALGKVLQVLDRMGLEVWIVPRGKAPRRGSR